ncbi:MAG: nucleotidyltransferase domain-containing protein [Muribaculaceae bacterium]|nr:nucleotidyltransferase domain-containing protein [Muribaculaceae bacterium]
MRTKQEYMEILSREIVTLRDEFGVKSLRLFGSVARGEQTTNSDVDVCVDMSPKMFLVIRLKRYLEAVLGTSVDVVRLHKHMNPFLKGEIDRDGIVIFQ